MLINTVTPSSLWLELTQIFDFSVDTTFKDYTYWYTSWGWLTIETANGWVTDGWSSYWNGSVYKEVNATKVWTRALINFNSTTITWNRGWGISMHSRVPWYSTWVYVDVQNWTKEIRCILNDVTQSATAINITLWNDYLVDSKFENWLYTGILLDTSENVLATTSYQSTDTEMKYIGFSMWNHGATPAFCRIKKFREWHE